MLSNETVRALATALRYYVLYERSNPEVGMGPSLPCQTSDILITSQIDDTNENRTQVMTAYNERWSR